MQPGRFFTFLAVWGSILGAGGAGYAQVITGTIAGRVTDQTGAVLPGVTVTVNSPQLLQQQTAVTSETGAYRFAELPIGTYTVRFEMPGFQTLVREDIELSAGMTATVNATLGLAQVAETVTVSGESPVVDVRQQGISYSFDEERLENLPTARDPWVILESTPGIVVDRQNVGGNESGQQSEWFTRGTDFSQNTWNYDGVNITDMAATGASPMYFDFAAFQEINISTGGEEAQMQTAGTHLNFVIKQGTNQLRGQTWGYATDDDVQGDNVDEELRLQGAGAGAPIKQIFDYGVEIGGPIVRDRLWAWGDYGVQDITVGTLGFFIPGCDDVDNPDCLVDDETELKNNNVKLNWQVSDANRFNFLWARNDKTKSTRGAAPTRPLETTWRQSGPTNIFKFEDTHVASANLLFTGRFAVVDGGFALDYQEPALRDVQGAFDLDTGIFSRSFLGYETDRPQVVANFDGNYFLSNALGGDHEFKFGFQYKHATIDSFTTYGGDVWTIFSDDQAAEAWFFRPGAISYEGDYVALYLEDIISTRRSTLRLGLRYDHQRGQNNPSQIPANTVIPDLMPAIDFPGTEGIDPWNTLSPRVGFSYDLTGDGRTIATASYARYYDLLLLSEQIAFNNAAGVSEMDLPWTDLNGDREVQANEVDASYVLYTSNFDPENPASLESPDVRDPETDPPITDEIIIGFQRELMPNFGVGANYIYKRFHNLIWDDWPYSGASGLNGLAGIDFPLVGIPNAAFFPVSTSFEGQEVTWYELPAEVERTGELLTNRPDYHQRYQGIEIFANKRLTGGWMLNGGFTFADPREYFDSPAGIYDPTNADIRDGGLIAPWTGGSGKTRIFLNSRWIFRVDGLVELPYDFILAGKLNARQGFPFIPTFRTPLRSGGIGRTEVILDPVGENRYQNLWMIDMRVEKRFQIGGARLSGIVDLFNLTNANTIFKRENRQNLETANRIEEILSPRILRFGLRLQF